MINIGTKAVRLNSSNSSAVLLQDVSPFEDN